MKYMIKYIYITCLTLIIFFIFFILFDLTTNNIRPMTNNKNSLPYLYYINLKDRMDRKKNIEYQLNSINYPLDKIKRIDAIRNINGATGCGLSHIKALETALKERKNDEYIMILEDDFSWKLSPTKTREILMNAINSINN